LATAHSLRAGGLRSAAAAKWKAALGTGPWCSVHATIRTGSESPAAPTPTVLGKFIAAMMARFAEVTLKPQE